MARPDFADPALERVLPAYGGRVLPASLSLVRLESGAIPGGYPGAARGKRLSHVPAGQGPEMWRPGKRTCGCGDRLPCRLDQPRIPNRYGLRCALLRVLRGSAAVICTHPRPTALSEAAGNDRFFGALHLRAEFERNGVHSARDPFGV